MWSRSRRDPQAVNGQGKAAWYLVRDPRRRASESVPVAQEMASWPGIAPCRVHTDGCCRRKQAPCVGTFVQRPCKGARADAANTIGSGETGTKVRP